MRSMGKADGVHVVKDFKLNIDPCVGNGSRTCPVIKDMCTPVEGL